MKKSYILFFFLVLSFLPATSFAAGDPILLAPAHNSTVSLCDFSTFVVNPNEPRARRISFIVWLNDPRRALSRDEITLTEETATQPLQIARSYEYLSPNEQYMVQMETYDANNVLLHQLYCTFFTKPQGNSMPTCTNIANGATGVSVMPTIQINPYTACGKLLAVTYWIDRYPADWQGSDMQTATYTSPTYSWTVPQSLEAGTEYEIRVLYDTDYEWGMPLLSGLRCTTAGTAGGRIIAANPSGAQPTVYPVPCQDGFSVQLPAGYQKAQIQLVAQNGRIVHTQQAQATTPVQFDTRTLASGLYLVRISDANGKTEQLKVVKQ